MINTTKLLVWGGGIGGGKAGNILVDYADSQIPKMDQYYAKELISLIGGPALVAAAYKLSQNPRHAGKADLIGLAGVELFIDRLAKLGSEALGIEQAPPRRRPGAPPPGRKAAPGHWPYSSQQRLPFQNDVTW